MIIETNPTVQTIETMTTDAAPFPAATGKWMPPVQDLDDLYTPEQQAFNATIAGKGLSAITDEDREAAARVGLTLCDYIVRYDCPPLKLVLPGMAVRNGR